jgi:transglutaminase-like putative cysteine protease
MVASVQVRVGCEFVHEVTAETHAIVQVEARPDGAFALFDERWTTEPDLGSHRFVDRFGNLCRRVTLPGGQSTLRYDALVDVPAVADPEDLDARELAPAELPDDALAFTLPSRFCPSDEMGGQAAELFGGVDPGWRRVQAICDWVHGTVAFSYGSSSATTTAADVLEAGKGVCRDFAHVAVTFCRALNIPTRYAFGYLPDIGIEPPDIPMDFYAWIEVLLGGVWWTFDPRNNQRRIGRVLVGRGRDALDVAMITTFGASDLQSMAVWADEVSA